MSMLQETELAGMYRPPAASFVAGMGFNNKVFWEELAGSNVEVGQWVKEGYSEYVPRYANVPFIERPNNRNTEQHQDFVSEEVQALTLTMAVKDVTEFKGDPDVVRVIAP